MSGRRGKIKSVKLLFMGVAFLIAGLGVWLVLTGETTFVCDRGEGECVLERQGVLSSEDAVVALGDIEGARLTESLRQSGDRPTYRAVLDAEDGSAKLSHINSTARDDHKDIVNRVNEFLDDPGQERLEISDDGGPLFRAMPPVFAVIGFLLLIGAFRGSDK